MDSFSVPKLQRQDAFYDHLASSRHVNEQQTKPLYRWLWMIKNEDHLLWRVYSRSEGWFNNYLGCKQDALQHDPEIASCTAVRLYVEIFNNGFENVVEVLHYNDPEAEPYFASEDVEMEEERNKHQLSQRERHRWEWQINTPNENVWKPYIQCSEWYSSFETCQQDGLKCSFDVICSTVLRLCIETEAENGSITTNYFPESK